MKTFPILLLGFALLLGGQAAGQSEDQPKTVVLTGIELGWQLAIYGDQIDPNDQIIRFSAVNLQSLVVHKPGALGYFGGLSLRNSGFLFPVNDQIDRIRYRTYNLGIPMGLLVGNPRLLAAYGGYELEFPLHYKTRTFSDDDALVQTQREWFSDKVPTTNHAVFLGFAFFQGINIKLKYYLSNFFNQDYVDEMGDQPFENAEVNIFSFSLNFFLFRNEKLFHAKQD